MKKLLILAIVLLASAGFAAAEDMAFTGWVADEACAKDFAKAGNAEHKGWATRGRCTGEWLREGRASCPETGLRRIAIPGTGACCLRLARASVRPS